MKTMPLAPPSCSQERRRRAFAATLLLAALSASTGCGGGGGGGGGAGVGLVGQEAPKPGGGSFFVDPNRGGTSTGLHLAELSWGRLVDVHDLDAQGRPALDPVFRDFVVNENVQSDGTRYLLETSPITQRTRLVILRRRSAPDTGDGDFDALLRQAGRGLAPILARGPEAPPPFSLMPRNATLVLRFDDCLDDSPAAWEGLVGDDPVIRVESGPEGARQPFLGRLLFDPNFGAVVGEAFHSTRILLDTTLSATEAVDLPGIRPVNAVGLPASERGRPEPSVILRLATRTDPAGGRFRVLRALSGAALATEGNGVLDSGAPTRDVLRALRSGNADDPNDGFLLDLDPPRILGGWNVVLDRIRPAAGGRSGFDFLVDLTFRDLCRATPRAGDVLQASGSFLEISASGAAPGVDGRVLGLEVRNLAGDPLPGAGSAVLGSATFLSTYDPDLPLPGACWVSFDPPPLRAPATGVDPAAEVLVRFSEPMNRLSMSPYDTFALVRGDSNTSTDATTRIPADVGLRADLRTFTLSPRLPLRHDVGVAEAYHLSVTEVTDLAGNALATALPAVDFTLDPAQPAVHSASTALRFSSLDEVAPLGSEDIRGQFFIDLARGVIRPRPVAFASYPADRTNPVPALMIPYAGGVQTPLSPLGSKLQTVWRYCDLGWQVKDESKYDLDVFGLSWAPVGGRPLNDFYERFEIALAHSRYLPDEDVDVNKLPKHVNSGLRGRNDRFTDNILNDPLSPQRVVHPRDLGYRVRATDLFFAGSGTRMLPFPLNRDPSVAPRTFTWRDTAALRRAGPGGRGIPLDIEVGTPLELEDVVGSVARQGDVPTIGLPLLMEFRCYPSASGVGQNAFDVSLAINSSAWPAFRSFSTGGVDAAGVTVVKDPDRELSPSGISTGNAHDNTFYIGQLDVVTRISRVHTAWIDTQIAAPDYIEPQILPLPQDQPSGTSVRLEFRGAHGFVVSDVDPDPAVDGSGFPFDARRLDPYGNIHFVDPETGLDHLLGTSEFPGSVDHAGPGPGWSESIDDLDGARFLQLRITFTGDIATLANAELSAVGLAYLE